MLNKEYVPRFLFRFSQKLYVVSTAYEFNKNKALFGSYTLRGYVCNCDNSYLIDEHRNTVRTYCNGVWQG